MGDLFLAFKVTRVGQGVPRAPASYPVNLIPNNQYATVRYWRQPVLGPPIHFIHFTELVAIMKGNIFPYLKTFVFT